MTTPWTFSGRASEIGFSASTVVLVEESTFAISDLTGDMSEHGALGLFFRDTRSLSTWQLMINGAKTEPLAVNVSSPFSATFVSRAQPKPSQADSTILVFRSRYLGVGMREDIRIKNYGFEASYCLIEYVIASDFADLFAVKEGRVKKEQADNCVYKVDQENNAIRCSFKKGSITKGVEISPSFQAKLDEGLLRFEVVVPARSDWVGCIEVKPIIGDSVLRTKYPCGDSVDRSSPTQRFNKWRAQVPVVECNQQWLPQIIQRSMEDLGALRIFDPDFPDRSVIAAGAPWFMTVFGRDSILTSWMALLADPDLALGVLQTLARFQGKEVNPANDEQPGRILHEMRFGDSVDLSLGGGSVYYGSVDATPLFVMLLGELRKWGLARELVDELLPHADRALEWIQNYGDLDGDGYVEYMRLSDRGLINQGWKDSFDSIRYSNGELAKPPIALCEVQGYVYGAYLARAHFAKEVGDEKTARHYTELAAQLRKNFNEDFWLEDKGWLAIGLDPEKKPIDSLASNMGHCLWTGILDREKAEVVAKRLLSPEMFTGWGIRTLASSMGGYNPISYHCGSVWPHDNSIIAAGLMRYGFVEEALKVVMAIFDTARYFEGRLPELFGGIDKSEFPTIVSYPTSCSPQAWASAAPLLAIRTILHFEPWVPQNKLWVAPNLPDDISLLKVERIPLAGSQVTITVEKSNLEIDGLPSNIELIKEPRSPHTALF
jgi:glycogen debranching enzyme